MKIWAKLKIIYSLIKLSKDPDNYSYIESFRKVLYQEGFYKRAMAQLHANPELSNYLKRRKLFNEDQVDLEKLKTLPANSLGKAYFDFLATHKIQPVYYSKTTNEVVDEETYYVRRVLQTHDFWHVLLNFGTSQKEELLIQSFLLCQVHWPTAPFIIGGLIFKTLFRNPTATYSYVSAIAEGWRLGLTTKNLFLVDWEDLLAADLNLLRSRWLTPMSDIDRNASTSHLNH